MMSSTIALFCLVTMGSAMVGAEDAAVLIKASYGINLAVLRSLEGTSDVYKVKLIYTKGVSLPKYMKYISSQWNYLVIGKGFKTADERKEFQNVIGAFSNVEASFNIGLAAHPKYSTTYLNGMIDWAKTQESSKSVVRPLKKVKDMKKEKGKIRHYCSGHTCTCDEITLNSMFSSQKIFQIDLSRVGDAKAFGEVSTNLLTSILPALGIRYKYVGRPIEDEFDAFNIVEYPSKATFCEYGLSQVIEDAAQGDAFESMVGLVAVPAI